MGLVAGDFLETVQKFLINDLRAEVIHLFPQQISNKAHGTSELVLGARTSFK